MGSADEADPRRLAALGRLGLTAATPFAPLALATTSPAGAVARAAALAAAPRGKRSMPGLGRLVDEAGAEFDGRLRIAAVNRKSGKRVMFGAPGAPPATVAQAVLASCAIPWVFAPVEIDGREYVDGGVWSPSEPRRRPRTPRHRGAVPEPDRRAAPAQLRVERGGAGRVARAEGPRRARRTIRPDEAAAEAMGGNFMDRSRAPQALAAGYAQGRALAG